LQRLLACERVAVAAGEQRKAVVQPLQDLLGRQDPDPGCGQLDRERHAVQALAQPGDRLDVIGAQREPRLAGGGPLGEQADRGVGTDLI
jgi:hypothetical protein